MAIGFTTTGAKANNAYLATLVVSEPTGASDSVTGTYTATVPTTSPLSVATSGGMAGACGAEDLNDAGVFEWGSETFTVTNNGTSATGALTVTPEPTYRGTFFLLPGADNCTGASLAPADSCTFQLRYMVYPCKPSE